MQRSIAFEASSVAARVNLCCVAGRANFSTQKSSRRCRRQVITRADGFNNLINQLSEVVTNSPVNNLKKGIAKVQAGAYDEAAIKSQVDAYLSDNAVSFVLSCDLLLHLYANRLCCASELNFDNAS